MKDIIPLFINALTGNKNDLCVLADALEDIGIENTQDLRRYPYRESSKPAQMLAFLALRKNESVENRVQVWFDIISGPKSMIRNNSCSFKAIDEKTAKVIVEFDISITD
jgi:methionine salvage enolase-phosphatase E1